MSNINDIKTELETINDNNKNNGVLPFIKSIFNNDNEKNIIKAFKLVHKELSPVFLDFIKKNNIDFEYCDNNGDTILHKLARYNYNKIADIVSFILKQSNKNMFINIQNNNNETPVFVAVSNGNNELAEVLIKNGADITIPSNNGTIAPETETETNPMKYSNNPVSDVISDTSYVNDSIFKNSAKYPNMNSYETESDTKTENMLGSMMKRLNNESDTKTENMFDDMFKKLNTELKKSKNNFNNDTESTETIVRKIQMIGGNYHDTESTEAIINNIQMKDSASEVANNVYNNYKGGNFFDNFTNSVSKFMNNTTTSVKNTKLEYEKKTNNNDLAKFKKQQQADSEDLKKEYRDFSNMFRQLSNSNISDKNISIHDFINKTFANDPNRQKYLDLFQKVPEIYSSIQQDVEKGNSADIKTGFKFLADLYALLAEQPNVDIFENFKMTLFTKIKNFAIDFKIKKNNITNSYNNIKNDYNVNSISESTDTIRDIIGKNVFNKVGGAKVKGSRSLNNTKRNAMSRVVEKANRTIARQENIIHKNVIKKIMEVMGVDEDTAKNYKAGLWSDLKKQGGDKWETMTQLAKATALEEVATSKNLKKVDLEKAAKIRKENAEKSAQNKSKVGGYSSTSDEYDEYSYETITEESDEDDNDYEDDEDNNEDVDSDTNVDSESDSDSDSDSNSDSDSDSD